MPRQTIVIDPVIRIEGHAKITIQLDSRDVIGIDQITFESDYPHQDSLWPHTLAYAEKAMAELTAEEIYKVVRGNAINLFQLPAEIG